MTEYGNSDIYDEFGTENQEENGLLWEELFKIHTQTLEELRCRIEALESAQKKSTIPASSESYIHIPACWYKHPVAVEELTALWAGWYAAYHQDDSPNMLAIDWHQRFFWPTLEHLKDHVYRECFRAGEHKPIRTAKLYLTDAGFEEFVAEDTKLDL